jgi:hypothetical protein
MLRLLLSPDSQPIAMCGAVLFADWQRWVLDFFCGFIQGVVASRSFGTYAFIIKTTHLEVEVEVILRPTVSQPVCLNAGLPSGAYDQIFVFCLTVAGFLMWAALSDDRKDL